MRSNSDDAPRSLINNFGQEQCYDNIRISKNAWDTNLVKVAPDIGGGWDEQA